MSKKRYVNIELFGKTFEFDTKEKICYTPIVSRTLWECYERPSSTKENIYEHWRNWFTKNKGVCTVASYNCMVFTLKGYVFDLETRKMYYCYITPTHNRCIEVV